MIANGGGDVAELFLVAPDLVEQLQIDLCVCGIVDARNEVRNRVALLIAEIDGREPADRHVGDVACFGSRVDELLHRRLGRVRPEASLPPYPFGALARDRTLCQLVAKLYLELGSVQASLTCRLG